MLTWIWDALFTRRVWVVLEKRDFKINYKDHTDGGVIYVLRDQWGNIKTVKSGTTN